MHNERICRARAREIVSGLTRGVLTKSLGRRTKDKTHCGVTVAFRPNWPSGVVHDHAPSAQHPATAVRVHKSNEGMITTGVGFQARRLRPMPRALLPAVLCWHSIPAKPAGQLHRCPPEGSSVQVPPFWQGLGPQAPVAGATGCGVGSGSGSTGDDVGSTGDGVGLTGEGVGATGSGVGSGSGSTGDGVGSSGDEVGLTGEGVGATGFGVGSGSGATGRGVGSAGSGNLSKHSCGSTDGGPTSNSITSLSSIMALWRRP